MHNPCVEAAGESSLICLRSTSASPGREPAKLEETVTRREPLDTWAPVTRRWGRCESAAPRDMPIPSVHKVRRAFDDQLPLQLILQHFELDSVGTQSSLTDAPPFKSQEWQVSCAVRQKREADTPAPTPIDRSCSFAVATWYIQPCTSSFLPALQALRTIELNATRRTVSATCRSVSVLSECAENGSLRNSASRAEGEP